MASKANQTIDQIYEIANASSPLELDKAQSQTRRSSSGRNASVDYLNDLEDLKVLYLLFKCIVEQIETTSNYHK